MGLVEQNTGIQGGDDEGGEGCWEQTIFILEMSGNDTCILWTYWPEIK